MAPPDDDRDRSSGRVGATRLELTLFGSPSATVDGRQAIGPAHLQALALLAHLLLERGRAPSRETLAALFWPDQPSHLAHQNLRQALLRLRRALDDGEGAPSHLVADGQTVRFDPSNDSRVDVLEFEALLATVDAHRHRRLEACEPCLELLVRAIALYRGPLLEGAAPSGVSAEYDDWLALARERLELRACRAMQAAAAGLLAAGRPEAARDAAARLLALDPCSDAAERLLLRALVRTEGRHRALRHHRGFRATLSEELGVEPEDATCSLVERIRQGATLEPDPRGVGRAVPVVATPIVGRGDELQSLRQVLAGPDARLVTVHGPGGVGKTRLSLELAAREAPLWHDGVWFVPLADVPGPADLPSALAGALGIETPAAPSESDVARALRSTEALLVLDSFEHLVGAAPAVAALLAAAPLVKIVVTSRTRLGLPEEWIFELGGLLVPDEAALESGEALRADAVSLFAGVAGRVRSDFELTRGNLPHIVRICRAVSGLPLGIELAASWLRVLTCAETADQIERDPARLLQRAPKDARRGESLGAALDWSYQRLGEHQRAVFRGLSVFRGGFDMEAAVAVTGADAATLATLVDHALVRRLRSGRLDMHLVIREMGRARLAESTAEQDAVRDRHRDHYLGLVVERQAALESDRAACAAAEIDVELANVRAAWQWALEPPDPERIREALPSLAGYLQHAGRFAEGQEMLGAAADRLLAFREDDPQATAVAARLRAAQADVCMRRGLHPEVVLLATEAVQLARAAGDPRCEANAEFCRGVALRQQFRLDEALDHLRRALELDATARAGEDRPDSSYLERRCLNDLAAICWGRGDLAGAERYLERMLDLCVRQGNRSDQAVALGNLGLVAVERGDYAVAMDRYEQSQALADAVGRVTPAAGLNLGELCLEVGAYADAEGHLAGALAVAREQSALKSQALTLCRTALLRHVQGRNAEAVRLAEEALGIGQDLADPSVQADVWLSLGRARAGAGDRVGAVGALQCALELYEGLPQGGRAAEARAGLAAARLADGDASAALEHVETILAHLRTGNLDGALCRSEVHLVCARVLRALDDPRYGAVLAAANAELEQRAGRITRDGMRRSFLENVPAHRQIVEEWRLLAAEAGRDADVGVG